MSTSSRDEELFKYISNKNKYLELKHGVESDNSNKIIGGSKRNKHRKKFGLKNFVMKYRGKKNKFSKSKNKIKKLHFDFGDIKKIEGDDFMEKLDIINKKFKKDLSINIPTSECGDCEMPKHMCIMDTNYPEAKLDEFFGLLEQTFHKNPNHKSFTHQRNKKRTFMFDRLSDIQTVQTAYELNPKLGFYLATFISDIINMLDVKDKDIDNFLNESKLVIARYSELTGLHVHIDKVRRADGPVITLGLGPSKSIYDLIPIQASKNPSLRIEIDKGQTVIMDGESRFAWFHALPFGYKYDSNVRYSLIHLTTKFQTLETFRDDFWDIDIDITATPCED